MKVYIGAVSGDRQHVKGMLSFAGLKTHKDDIGRVQYGTRGEVARITHGDNFIDSGCDAIFLLDLDMYHPPDILEVLRSHDLDMVSGNYYKRDAENPMPVAWLPSHNNKFPFIPMLDVPEKGLHEVASAGMGCVLIKREVFKAVYDTLKDGDSPFAIGHMPHQSRDHRNWGSDFRFFTLARELGYKLYLDVEVESKHATTTWIDREYYNNNVDVSKKMEHLSMFYRKRLEMYGMDKDALEARIKLLKAEEQKISDEIDELKMQQNELMKEGFAMRGAIMEREKELEFIQKPKEEENAPVAIKTESAEVNKERALGHVESVQRKEKD